ncbi:MAG: CBS domain-containing protein [Sulfurovaceae bacterium]
MLVEDIMTPKEKAVTIDPMTSVRKALELMREKKIKKLT